MQELEYSAFRTVPGELEERFHVVSKDGRPARKAKPSKTGTGSTRSK